MKAVNHQILLVKILRMCRQWGHAESSGAKTAFLDKISRFVHAVAMRRQNLGYPLSDFYVSPEMK